LRKCEGREAYGRYGDKLAVWASEACSLHGAGVAWEARLRDIVDGAFLGGAGHGDGVSDCIWVNLSFQTTFSERGNILVDIGFTVL
jgi:hypothetical protein